MEGSILHTGTWTGIGDVINGFNEYLIDSEVLLIQGQNYTIQLENQTAGGYVGHNPSLYEGGKFHYSGYGGEYGDLKMKIWVLLEATHSPESGTSSPDSGHTSPDSGNPITRLRNRFAGFRNYLSGQWARFTGRRHPQHGALQHPDRSDNHACRN